MNNHLRPAGHRLRVGRHSAPLRIYLITLVTRQRRSFFSDLYSGRTLVRALCQAQPSAATLCYVVMPDHLHWLMQLNPGANLSHTVKLVKSMTTRQLHRQRQIDGPIWQRGFHDHAIRKEEDLRAVARYVVANPLRAGLARSVRKYSLWDAVWL